MNKKIRNVTQGVYEHKEIGSILLLCLINILIRIPFFPYIPTNDENTYFESVLKVFQNNFNPFLFSYGYKPPFLFEITAFFFKIFGPSIVIGRLMSAMASSLSIWYTYQLGNLLFNKKTGLFATYMLFFVPLFAAQGLQFTDAIFVTPLFLATIYYYYKEQNIKYFICATILVLTRETTIIVPFYLGTMEIIKNIRITPQIKNIQASKSIILWLPLLPFICWMFINKWLFGWYLLPDNVAYFFSHTPLLQKMSTNLITILVGHGMLPFIILITLYLLFLITKKRSATKQQRHALILFLSLFIFSFLFYSIGPFHSRYMLFLYPFLCILASGAISVIWNTSIATYVTGGLCIFLITFQLLLYTYLPIKFWGEADLSYLHTQTLYQRSILTIDERFSHPLIVTIPLIYSWNDTSLGYAKNARQSNIFNWTTDIPEEQEYDQLITFAREHGLSPIVFVQQSNDAYIPTILFNKRVLLDTIYDGSINTKNYHLLYGIQTQ